MANLIIEAGVAVMLNCLRTGCRWPLDQPTPVGQGAMQGRQMGPECRAYTSNELKKRALTKVQ